MEPKTHPSHHIGRIIFYVATCAALILVYLRFSEVRLIKNIFLSVSHVWLAMILFFQILTYYFSALTYRDAFRMKDLRLSVKTLLPLTLIVQFVTQAIPTGGLSGELFFIHYLRRYNLTYTQSFSRAFLEVMTLYVAYIFTFIASLIILFSHGIFKTFPLLWLFVYIFILFFSLVAFFFLAIQKTHRPNWVSDLVKSLRSLFSYTFFERIKRNGFVSKYIHYAMDLKEEMKNTLDIDFLISKSRLFFMSTLWQLLLLIANGITVYYIARAVGVHISMQAAFVVFVLPKLLSIISIVPGALGIYELGMTGALIAFNVSPSSAIAITLVFRALTFWLPMPIGWILYGHYIKNDNHAVS